MRRYRKVSLGPADVVVERRPGGIVHLRSPHALPSYPKSIIERLEHWAARAPHKILFAQRKEEGNGWRSITYAEALVRARRIGECLVRRNLSDARLIVVLSGKHFLHVVTHH